MRRDTPKFGVLAVIAIVVGIAALIVSRSDPWVDSAGDSKVAFALNLDDLIEIDPASIQFALQQVIDLSMDDPRGICVGSGDQLLVVGDQQLQFYARNGALTETISFDADPKTVAFASEDNSDSGRVYVGLDKQVIILSADGQRQDSWILPIENATVTSISVGEERIWVADARGRVVIGFNEAGELVDQLGQQSPGRTMPGFVIPSDNFDVVVDDEDRVHVVNPGRMRIEAYSGGQLESYWGVASPKLEGFFGCCNPSHLALLPTGEFVTSEKGIPRIKLYSPLGRFECVVAGPAELGVRKSEIGDPRTGVGQTIFDVTTNSAGHVLVLDPKQKRVLVFERKAAVDSTETGLAT